MLLAELTSSTRTKEFYGNIREGKDVSACHSWIAGILFRRWENSDLKHFNPMYSLILGSTELKSYLLQVQINLHHVVPKSYLIWPSPNQWETSLIHLLIIVGYFFLNIHFHNEISVSSLFWGCNWELSWPWTPFLCLGKLHIISLAI